MPELAVRTPESRLYRIGYEPDPWQWTPWSYASQDGRFDGRWDDPDGMYRVLYAGSTRFGCFVEVLAQFRPDPEVVAGLAEIKPDPRDEAWPTAPAGCVPASWMRQRRIGSAAVAGSFVQIDAARTIATLRSRFLARLNHYKIADLDGAAIRSTVPRGFTRELSRFVYDLPVRADLGEPWAGVSFESRFGTGLRLWAIFEREPDFNREHSHRVTQRRTAMITPSDRDFQAALDLHGLRLDAD